MCNRSVEDVALRDIVKVSDDLLTRMGQRLVDETSYGRIGSRLYGDAIACLHVLRNYAELTAPSPSASGCFSKPMMRKLEDYVRERVAEDLSRDTLARVAGVSSCTFSRLFRNSFGLPPHR